MNFIAQIKDINIKTLVSGDKSGRIVLEITTPEDVTKLASLAESILVNVQITPEKSG